MLPREWSCSLGLPAGPLLKTSVADGDRAGFPLCFPAPPQHLHGYQPQDLPKLLVPLRMSLSCVSLLHLSQKEPGAPSLFFLLIPQLRVPPLKMETVSFIWCFFIWCPVVKEMLLSQNKPNQEQTDIPSSYEKKKKKTNLKAEDRSDIPRKKYTPLCCLK